MFNGNKVLAVIPAIDDSEGIPRQNTRLLGEKPLIAHTIDTLKSSEYVDDVVVLSKNDEVSRISELYGVTPFRNSNDEETTFEAHILEAMLQREKAAFDEYDVVMVVKPNAPLITVGSINGIIEKFENHEIDSVISVKEDKHLRWGLDQENNRYFPIYSQRMEEANLPPQYIETGSIIATRRHFVTEESILGLNIDLIELSDEESIIVDNFEDLWIAEKHFNKKKIVIVVNAFDEIGMGHVKRSLAIASKLIVHDVIFVSNSNYPLGIEAITAQNYPCVTYDDSDEIFGVINQINPDLVINNVLDTSFDYISQLREKNYFVIDFEDLGPGIEAANLVFNALSDFGIELPNVFTGYKYYILEDEFYFQPPKVIQRNVNRVLVMFLGNDPNNLTEKTIQALISSGYSGNIDVLLGVGYPNKKEIIEKYDIFNNVVIYESVRSMSEFIGKADIVFTSAERTVYEVCSIGVPCICMCQDNRELANTFANVDNGIINLGLGNEVSIDQIAGEFSSLAENFDARVDMNQRMLNIDLKNGFTNVWSIVKKFYADFELEEDF